MESALIWDLDGTLLDSYPVIVSSLKDTYSEYGIELDREEIHRYVITYSVTAFIEKMAGATGLAYDQVKPRYSELGNQRISHIRLIPGAKETLAALKAGGAKHFVYTHRGASTEAILKQLDILEQFEEVVTSQNGFARKPAPDALLYLMGKYGLDPDHSYYVGDRTIDMDCARNARLRGILYLPAGSRCRANGSETFIVHDLQDIAGISL